MLVSTSVFANYCNYQEYGSLLPEEWFGNGGGKKYKKYEEEKIDIEKIG
jgi:hypothetical protein